MIEDVRSKGLELEKLESVTDTLGQTYVEGTDYTRTEETVADGHPHGCSPSPSRACRSWNSWAGQRGR